MTVPLTSGVVVNSSAISTRSATPSLNCRLCKHGHPDCVWHLKSWGHDGCDGGGMRCPRCSKTSPAPLSALTPSADRFGTTIARVRQDVAGADVATVSFTAVIGGVTS